MGKIRTFLEKINNLNIYKKLVLAPLFLLLLTLIVFWFISIFAKKQVIQLEKSKVGKTTNVYIPTTQDIEFIQSVYENIPQDGVQQVVFDDWYQIGQIPPTIKATTEQSVSGPTRVIVYGMKTNKWTELREVNFDGTNDHVVAYLPSNIKDVHPISNHGFLYIAGVDEFDHGQSIEIYDTKTQTAKTLASATSAWGIDDILISPDGSLLGIWEVKFAPNQKVMLGGLSSVYLLNVRTLDKQLIVTEKASETVPIHYPKLFDVANRLFLDTWIPNKGRQFFLGMSFVSPDNPTQIIPIKELDRGKFNSAPVLAPVGNKVVFSGFDQTAAFVVPSYSNENPKRPEMDNPNQIVVLNLDDFTTSIYTDKQNTRFYVDPKWSPDGSEVIYTRYNPYSTPPEFEGVYSLNLATLTESKIDGLTDERIRPIKYLGSGSVVYQMRSPTQGNLGETYASVTEAIYKYENGGISSVVQGSNIQYISNLTFTGLQSQSAFVLPAASLIPPQADRSVTFESFEVDPLAYRDDQQNAPIPIQEDNSTENPDITPSPPPKPTSPPDDNGGCTGCACNWNCGEGYPTSPCWVDYLNSACHDSPLYLYPVSKTDVVIKPILSGQIQYEWPRLSGNSWQVVAHPDGTLITQDNIEYDKIEYSFTTSLLKNPKQGIVVADNELSPALKNYAVKVGLKEKEVSDFVSFWVKQLNILPSPYYFVSHFDSETASKIMSFEITPKPNTFIQVVMYFKPLQYPMSVQPPIFEEVPERAGFVAVDWSGKIELPDNLDPI